VKWSCSTSRPTTRPRRLRRISPGTGRGVKSSARGLLESVGAFADPQRDGAMAVFTTREAAEEFVAGDPFVLNDVVRRWELRGWNEALSAS
jgi:hypothetical protein